MKGELEHSFKGVYIGTETLTRITGKCKRLKNKDDLCLLDIETRIVILNGTKLCTLTKQETINVLFEYVGFLNRGLRFKTKDKKI